MFHGEFVGLDHVDEGHGDGEGADTAGDGSEESCFVLDGVEGDVAGDSFRGLYDADVDDACAGFDMIGGDEVWDS